MIDAITGAVTNDRPDKLELIGVGGPSLTPFTRYEIILSNIDRQVPVLINAVAGDSIFVERCDAMCYAQFVTAQTGDRYGAILRDGFQMSSPFNGFYLSHPNYIVADGRAIQKLVLYVAKGAVPDQAFVRQYNRYALPYFVNSSSSGAFGVKFPIPSGARIFKCQLANTTNHTSISKISGTIRFDDAAGNPCYAPQMQRINPVTGAIDTYTNTTLFPGFYLNTRLWGASGSFTSVCEIEDMPVPGEAYTARVDLDITGAGGSTNIGQAAGWAG